MAEQGSSWRTGVNAAKAEATIQEVSNLIKPKKPGPRQEPFHISRGLTGVADSLMIEGGDPKWRLNTETLRSQIKGGAK